MQRNGGRIGILVPWLLLAAGCPADPGASGQDAFVAADVKAGDDGQDAAIGTDPGNGELPGTDAVSGDPDVLAGRFAVILVAPVAATTTTSASPGYTSVIGTVQDGVTPELVRWGVAATDGDCRLLTPSVPFCSTPCGGIAACVADDVCLAYPALKDVGVVTVKGIHPSAGGDGFTMTPIGGTYQPLVDLPYPSFAEGETIRFEAAGKDYPAFQLEARGIAPFSLAEGEIALGAGNPIALSWTPPATAGASTVHVKLDISHHGGSKGKVECDAPDTGSLTVSGTLVKRLLDLGVAGFPTIVVGRRSVGSTVIAPGRVDLEISSDIERVVTVPGVVSCNGSEDCPENQACQDDLTCR